MDEDAGVVVGEGDLALVDDFRAVLSEALSKATVVKSSMLGALIGRTRRQ